VSPMAAEQCEERPRRGDRVKLIGDHPDAGCRGVYFSDECYYEGGKLYPVVKLETTGARVVVRDPENQMRKL